MVGKIVETKINCNGVEDSGNWLNCNGWEDHGDWGKS